MCGIVGFYSDRAPALRTNLEVACEQIRHRGPDAANVYIDERVGLGHRRLSIIDLSAAANQPMADASGEVILIYNGEIYNYRELREDLRKRGHEFRTNSDTEVVLHMYLEFKDRLLSALQGMFAFAIWDKRDETIFIARDRLGIKPLYYSVKEKALFFASEIKALLALDANPVQIDRQALHDYLTFRYTVSPWTLFSGINKLPPAHYLRLSRGGMEVFRYWQP